LWRNSQTASLEVQNVNPMPLWPSEAPPENAPDQLRLPFAYLEECEAERGFNFEKI
jgi:hypothetical protein